MCASELPANRMTQSESSRRPFSSVPHCCLRSSRCSPRWCCHGWAARPPSEEADFTLRGLVSEFAERGAVKTKQRKTFETWFFPAGQDIEQIVVDRVRFLI